MCGSPTSLCVAALLLLVHPSCRPPQQASACLSGLSPAARNLLKLHASNGGSEEDISNRDTRYGYLNLRSSGLVCTDVPAIFELAENFPGIRQLGLTANAGLGQRGAMRLAECLRQHRTHVLAERLEGLFLSDTRAGDGGVTTLMPQLAQLTPWLQRLALNSNGISDLGAEFLARQLLAWRGEGLHTLGLSGNKMASAGVAAVLDAACRVAKPLTKLFLNDNFGADSAGHAAAALLRSSNGRSLRRLGLAGQGIGEEAARAIHAAVLQVPDLEFVCLYNNPIGEDMFQALRRVPQVNLKPRGGHLRSARSSEWWKN
eukprot:TRINITY_DN63640_c0_g1_i1.p1 TRINITY_DN63640_c0_g1~~TRINITY_DN63640_c0_g1_i1.p1  ORF type:complete len:316 (+),score=49.61 TRINITY_DN63640_c0_g1_i1:54-1001(+)